MAQRRIDLAAVDIEPALQPIIKGGQGDTRQLGSILRTGDGEAIAARHHGDAEVALDAIEMPVALAEELRQQRIVVELHLYRTGRSRSARDGTGHQAATSVLAMAPARLRTVTLSIRTGTIRPLRSFGATAWTA
jgi:hypothetical protein